MLFGLGIEVLGVHTGWPFGVYEYDASLGVQLFGVPLIVPCAWVMMVHPCAYVRHVVSRATGSFSMAAQFLRHGISSLIR